MIENLCKNETWTYDRNQKKLIAYTFYVTCYNKNSYVFIFYTRDVELYLIILYYSFILINLLLEYQRIVSFYLMISLV